MMCLKLSQVLGILLLEAFLPSVLPDPSTSGPGMIKLQNQSGKRLCMQISDKKSKDDVPVILGPCTEDNTWEMGLAGRWDPDGLGFQLLYHFELITNPKAPLRSPTLMIRQDADTKELVAGFYYRVYKEDTTWVYRSIGIKRQPFELRPAIENPIAEGQCMVTSQDRRVIFKPCDRNTLIWRTEAGRFKDNFGKCLGRDDMGHAIMDECSGKTKAAEINQRPIYFIKSSQVPDKCANLLVTGKWGTKYSGNLTTGDCFFTWNFYWTKVEDEFSPEKFNLLNPISEQAMGLFNEDPQIITGPLSNQQNQQWLDIAVRGQCKEAGVKCEGVFGGCCSGQCAQTCTKLCVQSGGTCDAGNDRCCSAVEYCSHKPTCDARNPLTCHKAGELCWDCCGGRKCSSDRKCVCGYLNDCCDAQALCTSGICTAKPGSGIDSKPQCNGKSVLGGSCSQDSDCCESDGMAVKCNGGKCSKVCYWNDLEYCTNDGQCCAGRKCSQDQKCTTQAITGRPSREQCQLAGALCKTDYDCCDKCVLSRDGKHLCTGSRCNVLGAACNVAGANDARGKDCCRGGITCRSNKCVSCKNEGDSCGNDNDCCPGTEPRVYFKCEQAKCKKYWSVPTCLGAGEESAQSNCFKCCNGYNSCTVNSCNKGIINDNCYFCNPGSGGAQCKSGKDCKSGKCDPRSYYCISG